MKIIKPSVKTSLEFANELYKKNKYFAKKLSESQKIEVASRTCYNSFGKIDPYNLSDVSICKNMIKSKHFPTIEFGYICLNVNKTINDEVLMSGYKYMNQTFSEENGFIISGSIRAWRDLIIHLQNKKRPELSMIVLDFMLSEKDVSFMFEDLSIVICKKNNSYNIFQRIHDKNFNSGFTYEEENKHIYRHFVIETDRAVLAELTRHRPVSFCVSSQRYIKYTDGVTFVEPHWYSDIPDMGIINKVRHFKNRAKWLIDCKLSEFFYLSFLKGKMKAQDARSVLNNSTMCLINISCNKEEYSHIFNMRCSSKAHPDMIIIANKMKDLLNNSNK